MFKIGITTERTNTNNTQTDAGPLPTPKEVMRAKIQSILKQTVEDAEKIDSKELVKRATIGTPNEQLFS